MSSLPDEIWGQILLAGVRNSRLEYRDLSAVAIVSRRFNYISRANFVWTELVRADFPEHGEAGASSGAAPGSIRLDRTGSEWKALYRTKFEKVRKKKIAAHQRLVSKAKASLTSIEREAKRLQKALQVEKEKLFSSQEDLARLERMSRASTALQVWQPQAVSTQHQRVVQQMPVDLVAQRLDTCMKIQECRLAIRLIEWSYNKQQFAMVATLTELDALEYNPVRSLACLKVAQRETTKRQKK